MGTGHQLPAALGAIVRPGSLRGFSLTERHRIGIFGWGLVGPKSPNIAAFESNLEKPKTLLEPFTGFGPNNFLVGMPDFNFQDYKPWIDAHFEPRKFAQLDAKMGSSVKYAIGAFIQALDQNEGMEQMLRDLGDAAHVYVGTGIGEFPLQYDISLQYYKTLRRWNRFWCRPENHPHLARYQARDATGKAEMRALAGAPADPAELDPEEDGYDDARDAWHAFWVHHNSRLADYLDRLKAIEGQNLEGDVDANKGHLIRRKLAAKVKLDREFGCPQPPWSGVSANILWNIGNIAAAQITMLGRITGPSMAPVAACSGFITGLKMGCNAIRLGEAKVCVIGNADPVPHELTVSAFNDARVIANDGEVSKPFTGLRGTHISGGACIWIIGDYDYLSARGFKPVGLEIAGIGLTSDAHHIITPNKQGPRAAIRLALQEAGIGPSEVATWDMHATATPGDWTELQNAMAEFPDGGCFTARKGCFGHGMSVCGGWELTAQHLGATRGCIYPVPLGQEEIHESILPFADKLVAEEPRPFNGRYTGKINMGVGGVNACLICKTWDP